MSADYNHEVLEILHQAVLCLQTKLNEGMINFLTSSYMNDKNYCFMA